MTAIGPHQSLSCDNDIKIFLSCIMTASIGLLALATPDPALAAGKVDEPATGTVLITGSNPSLGFHFADQPIDVLLNNAARLGELSRQNFGALDFGLFGEILQTNLFGALRVTEALLPNVAMSEQKKWSSWAVRRGRIQWGMMRPTCMPIAPAKPLCSSQLSTLRQRAEKWGYRSFKKPNHLTLAPGATCTTKLPFRVAA